MSATITIVDDEITAEMQRAQEAEEELSNRITVNSEGLAAEITRATGAEDELSAAITATAESISVEVQKGLNGQGGYSSIYQTASQVSTIVANDAYVKRAGITIETDGIHMFASSSSQTSTVDITPSAINVKSGSALNVSSGANINVASGGKLIITSDNFTIDSNGNVTVKGNIQATSGSVGGWTIDASSIKNGKVGFIKTSSDSEVAIFAGNASANSAPFRVTQGGALIATNATITGDITATSGSFTGSITSTSGTIGGWTIDSNSLHSGTGANYVAITTSGDYALWSGASTASSAPFRVGRDGSVYITDLKVKNEQGEYESVDLSNSDSSSSYPLWKLNYATVRNISVTGNTLTIQTTSQTINFNKATSSSLIAEGGGGSPNFTVKAVHYEGSSTPVVDDSGIVSGQLSNTPYTSNTYVSLMFEGSVYGQVNVGAVYTKGHSDGEGSVTVSGVWSGLTYTATASNGERALTTVSNVEQRGPINYNSTTHNSTISVGFYTGDGVDHSAPFVVSGANAYNAGVTDGTASVTLTDSWSGGTYTVTASNGASASTSVTGDIAYNSGNHTYTGYALNGTVRRGNGKTSGTEAYDAGIIAGEGHFSSAGTVYTVSSGDVITTIGTKATPTTKYDRGDSVSTSEIKVTPVNGTTATTVSAKTVRTLGSQFGFYKRGSAFTITYGMIGQTAYGTGDYVVGYDAGDEITYYDVGGTGTWYKAGSQVTYNHMATGGTYYKGNGGAVYDIGGTGNWYRAGTNITPTTHTNYYTKTT